MITKVNRSENLRLFFMCDRLRRSLCCDGEIESIRVVAWMCNSLSFADIRPIIAPALRFSMFKGGLNLIFTPKERKLNTNSPFTDKSCNFPPWDWLLLSFLILFLPVRDKCKWIEDSRLIGCNVHEVVYNQMFSEMTFLLTELLELVEGKEASGPAGPVPQRS